MSVRFDSTLRKHAAISFRRAIVLLGTWFCCAASGAATAGEAALESARAIPVAYQVNVVVVGASNLSTGELNSVRSRRDSLRELVLARALYRCGDYQGLGEKILRQYIDDLRGHLSRHAQAVLQKGK